MSYQLPAVLNSRLNSLLSHASVVRQVRGPKHLRHASESDTALCYSRDIWRCRSAELPPISSYVPVCDTRRARKERPCNAMHGEAYGREPLSAAVGVVTVSVPANNDRTCPPGPNALRCDQRSRFPR